MRFYQLYHKDSRGKFIELNHDDPGRRLFRNPCPVHGKFGGAGYWDGNLNILLEGDNIGDIEWTYGSDCLIQDHVLQTFKDEGLTGFTVKALGKTTETDKKKYKPVNLHELVVTGWGGDASPESGAALQEYCPICFRARFSGITDFSKLIDINQWDNSDFFIIWPLPLYIFVTEKVSDILRQKGFSGYELTPVQDLRPISGLGPGLPPKGKTHQRYLYDERGHITNWKEILEPPPELF